MRFQNRSLGRFRPFSNGFKFEMLLTKQHPKYETIKKHLKDINEELSMA